MCTENALPYFEWVLHSLDKENNIKRSEVRKDRIIKYCLLLPLFCWKTNNTLPVYALVTSNWECLKKSGDIELTDYEPYLKYVIS